MTREEIARIIARDAFGRLWDGMEGYQCKFILRAADAILRSIKGRVPMKEQSGVIYSHDQWWWKDPDTDITHGPFTTRQQARDCGKQVRDRKLQTATKEVA